MNKAPKGISQNVMWNRMVRSERRAKRATSVGRGGFKFKLGNPIGVKDLLGYGGVALVAGVAEGKGWLPQAWNIGGMSVDTRLVTAGGLILANMIKPVKAIVSKVIPKRIQTSIVVVQATSFLRDQGRNLATKF